MEATPRARRFFCNRIPRTTFFNRCRSSGYHRLFVNMVHRFLSRCFCLSSCDQLGNERDARWDEFPCSVHARGADRFPATSDDVGILHCGLNPPLAKMANDRFPGVCDFLVRRCSFVSLQHLLGGASVAAKTPAGTIARFANGTPSGPNVQTVGLRAGTGSTPTDGRTNVEVQ